jgi:type IX secretion system PorP/SprF family membrane protein
MDREKLFVWVAVMLIGFGFKAEAQDIHFSQYYANPIYLNPAYAGTYICPRIIVDSRLQWYNLSGKYTTYSASYDQYFDKLSGGVGVLFTGDHAAKGGQISTFAASLMYSFRLNLTHDKKNALLMALQATWQQKHLAFDRLTFEDMIDPKYGFVYHTKEELPTYTEGVADFSAGIAFYSERFYGGIAVNHFTQPKESFYDNDNDETLLPMKLSANFGAMIDFKRTMRTEKTPGDMSLSPNIIFLYQSRFTKGAVYTSINYGLYLSCYPMVLGTWFRQGIKNSDAVIFLVGIEQKVLKIGFSYDFTIPTNKTDVVKMKTGGAYELSAQFHLPCPQKSTRIPHMNCPQW